MSDKNTKPTTAKDEPKKSKLEQERDEYLAGWQRERADFQNYKKDIDKLLAVQSTRAEDRVLLDVLQLVDYLQMALAHVPAEAQSQPWYAGFTHIQRELERLLGNYDVVAFSPLGEAYDAHQHEAIETVESTAYPAGHVAAVLAPGYRRRDHVIRAARVNVVAESVSETSPPTDS